MGGNRKLMKIPMEAMNKKKATLIANIRLIKYRFKIPFLRVIRIPMLEYHYTPFHSFLQVEFPLFLER